MLRWLRRLFRLRDAPPSVRRAQEASRTGPKPPEAWENELIQQAVEHCFAPEHREVVLRELASMRTHLYTTMGAARIDPAQLEQLAVLVVRAQLVAIERATGDVAFFGEKRYMVSDNGLDFDRD